MTDLQLWHRCREVRDSGKHLSGGVKLRAGLTDTAGVWEEERLICCDGSDTWQEWVCNVFAFRTGINGVHQSYDRAAYGIFRQVIKSVAPLQEWTIAGHSRGGAIALILGVYLARMGVVVRVVTFGAPKAGSKRFQRAVREKVASATHYTVTGDIVSNIPRWWESNAGDTVALPRQSINIVSNHLSYGEALS